MNTIFTWLIVIAIGIVGYMTLRGNEAVYSNLDEFAQCLAKKNIIMYGADWCTDCKNETRSFGDAWRYVKYVECPKNAEMCAQKKVVSYPTWIFPNGDMLLGEQGVERLSKASGCPLRRL